MGIVDKDQATRGRLPGDLPATACPADAAGLSLDRAVALFFGNAQDLSNPDTSMLSNTPSPAG